MKPAAERVVAYDDGIEVASHSRLHGVYSRYPTWPGTHAAGTTGA